VGWTSIYQLFWCSLGTRVLTHPHFKKNHIGPRAALQLSPSGWMKPPRRAKIWWSNGARSVSRAGRGPLRRSAGGHAARRPTWWRCSNGGIYFIYNIYIILYNIYIILYIIYNYIIYYIVYIHVVIHS